MRISKCMIMVVQAPHGVTINEERGPLLGWFSRPRDFEKAVEPELSVLYRVARRMGGTAEQAEDLVQITIVKAFQAWNRFDGRHLRSWLIRILRNEFLMSVRSAKVETSLDEPDTPEVPQQAFWADLAWKLQADKLMEELDQLPGSYRMVIQLCDVEQLSYEEAAQAMDCPVGTIRSRLFRARAMLRDRLVGIISLQEESC